jgi:hypothetical protein
MNDGYALSYDGPYVKVYYHTINKWRDEAFRTVDFGETEQIVSDEFYEWFTANAVMVDTLYSIRSSSLTAIADAIRAKTGKTDFLTLEQMVTEIGRLELVN